MSSLSLLFDSYVLDWVLEERPRNAHGHKQNKVLGKACLSFCSQKTRGKATQQDLKLLDNSCQ